MAERYIDFILASQIRKDFQQLLNWLHYNLDDAAKAITGKQLERLEELTAKLRAKWNSYHWGES